MVKAPVKSRSILSLLAAALIAGCSAPPSKPPTPKSLSSQSAPRAPGDDRAAGGEPAGMQPGGPGAPGSGEGYGAASANAADVEEEEVAADGSTRLISSSRRAPPATTGAAPATGGAGAQGSGGGAMPPASAPATHGQGYGGGGPKTDPQGAGPAYSDMIGIEEAPSGSGPDNGAATDTPGRPAGGRQDAADARATRLGVRGGVDESGATHGTPAGNAMPPPQRNQAAVRENDILAQQLQEAAEKEKDPVLREKLWAEYRKYKAGL